MLSAKRIKEVIESRSGLALGDALNVAMFLFTVLSLVVAVISVAIAVRTYRSADEGATKQAAILKTQANTLMAANQALANLLDQSKRQLDASQGQLVSSKKLVDEMNRGLETSEEQLDVARRDVEHHQELESRHPVVRGEISCSDVEPDSLAIYALLFHIAPFYDNQPVIYVKRFFHDSRDGYQTYNCALLLTNEGTAPVEDGFMQFRWRQGYSEGLQTRFIEARATDYNESVVGEVRWQREGFVLFDKAKLYTKEISMRPSAYRFQLHIPDEIEGFPLDYEIMGSNLPLFTGTVFIDQGKK